MCPFPGCGFAGLKRKSVISNHHHEGNFGVIESSVQVILKGNKGRQVWPIDENYVSCSALDPHLQSFFMALFQEEESRWNPTTMDVSNDPRHVNGFLATFGWLKLTERLPFQELHEITLARVPTDPQWLQPLSRQVAGYFKRIHPLIEITSPVILKWVNSTAK
jgi:hypothetical protein